MAVLDCYSLFLQQEIIDFIYRSFTFINQRKIERLNVVFIRYTNSLLYIQRFIDRTLKKHREYCRVFIDDITIFSDFFKNYIEYLNSVFSLFQKKNIGFNIEKSFIGYPSIELLKFYIDILGIHFTEDHI